MKQPKAAQAERKSKRERGREQKRVGEKEKGRGRGRVEESECKRQLGKAALIASNGPLNVDFAFEVGQAMRCIV